MDRSFMAAVRCVETGKMLTDGIIYRKPESFQVKG